MCNRMSGSIEMTRKGAIRADGRKMFDDVGFKRIQGTRKTGYAFKQHILQIMVNHSDRSPSIDFVLVFSFFGISGYILPQMQVVKL